MSAAYVWSYLYLHELNLGRWKENSFHTFSTFVHNYRLKGTPPILEKGESRELEDISISYKCFIAQEFVREIPLISYGIHDAAPDCPKRSTQVSKMDTHPSSGRLCFQVRRDYGTHYISIVNQAEIIQAEQTT